MPLNTTTFGDLLYASSTPWDVIPKIGTIFSLIAFLVAVIVMYLRYRTLQTRKTIENVADDNQVQIAERVLEEFHVPIEDLTKIQKFDLAKQKLKDKARHRMTQSILLAFLAVVVLIAVLAYKPNALRNNGNEDDTIEQSEEISYQVFVDVFQDSLIKRDRTEPFQHRNDHCSGETPVQWRINADTLNGWYIDVTSIKAVPDARENSIFNGVIDKSRKGFTIHGYVRNSGECVEIAGSVVSNDARGKLSVSTSYVEEKLVRSKSNFEQKIRGKFRIGKSEEVKIPENTANYSIILTNSGGESTKLSDGIKSQGKFSVQELGKTKLLIQS